VDRGGHSLFDRRGDCPWRDGDPTKGSTVLGVAPGSHDHREMKRLLGIQTQSDWSPDKDIRRVTTLENSHKCFDPVSLLRVEDIVRIMKEKTVANILVSSFWSTASTISANLSYFHSDYSKELAESHRFSHHKVWHTNCSINNSDRVRRNRHELG
jgi:hypothetical protein